MPVSYINYPEQKVLSSRLPDTLIFQIKSTGLQLLSFNFLKSNNPIIVDLYKANYDERKQNYIFEARSSIDTVAKQFPSHIIVERILPDIIMFSVKSQRKKTVPVVLKALLSYEKPFQLNGNIKLNPSTVELSGDSTELAQMEYVETEGIVLRNLNKSFIKNIKLKLPASTTTLSTNINSVLLTIPVEKFTEASLSVPIRCDNPPRGFVVKTIPDRVKITYIVALSSYAKIKEDMFLVAGNYAKSKRENSDKLKLEIIKTPQFVRNVKLNVEKVDYILKKL